MVVLRAATAEDISSLQTLIVDHARNQWSYPTDAWMAHYFEAIDNGKAQSIVACDNEKIVGAAVFERTQEFARYQQTTNQKDHAYIAEIVVDGTYAKQGIGTDLLRAAIAELTRKGIKTIYAKRHEENAPSARMMEKCGFAVIDVFDDPERTSGSRRTAICQLQI